MYRDDTGSRFWNRHAQVNDSRKGHRILGKIIRRAWAASFLFVSVGATPVVAEAPRLAAELAPGLVQMDTFRSVAAVSGDRALLWVDDGARGQELWITDGTPEGTRLWTEVCPGDCGPVDARVDEPGEVVFDGQRAYFAYDDGIHGMELWTADGSDDGTRLVADVCPGHCGSEPSELAWLNGKVYFAAATAASGAEPWVTDGTAAGTRQLGDLQSGPEGSSPRAFVAFGHGAAFQATTSGTGTEWWSSDGTAAGTGRRTDLCPGQCSADLVEGVPKGEGFVSSFILAEEERLFSLSPGGQVDVLASICQENCSEFPRTLYAAGDLIYTGRRNRLWRTDGSLAGTNSLELSQLTEQVWDPIELDDGSVIFLSVEDEFFWYVGRIEGDSVSQSIFISGFFPTMVPLQGRGVLIDQFNTLSVELISTDGTFSGTETYAAFDDERQWETYSEEGIVSLGDRALIPIQTPGPFGLRSLFSTNGVAEEPLPVLDFSEQPATFFPEALTGTSSHVLFRVQEGPREQPTLWGLDTDIEEAEVIFPIGSFPENLEALDLAVGPRVFLRGFRRSGLPSPFLSDGTNEGTIVLGDTFGSSILFNSREPVAFRGDLFFLADESFGQDIYRTDGTRPADLLVDLQPDWLNDTGCDFCDPPRPAGPIYPHDFRVIGQGDQQRLVFVARQNASGAEVWQSDGTAEGTALLWDLVPGVEGSHPETLMPVGQGMAFTAQLGAERTLWIWPGSGEPQELRSVGEIIRWIPWQDRVVWLEETGTQFSLYTSDGTSQGTRRLLDVPPGLVLGLEWELAGDRLFLTAADALGAEPWVVTLGPQSAELRPVADLWPGPRGSYPRDFLLADGQLYFSADNGDQGRELWTLDTRRDSLFPRLLSQVVSGPFPSSPRDLVVAESADGGAKTLVFSANDGTLGRELWRMPLPDTPGVCVPGVTTLCLRDGRFRVSVQWQDNANGTQGIGQTLPGTDETGFFWFFNASNLELAVKIVDGRDFNGAHWVFYGALSDVEYQISVEDLDTGRSQIYTNPQGSLCGLSDIEAFPEVEGLDSLAASAVAGFAVESIELAEPAPLPHKGAGCVSSATSACLLDRFQVEVSFTDHSGNEGTGQVASQNDQTSLFWFFGPQNIELAVKLIDGRTFNDRFWVFYGALSDVEYTIRVLDSLTGSEKVYRNEPGELCGLGDTNAFLGSP